MHEWEWGIQPAAPGKDPLSVLGTIGSVAARNFDIESLVLATQTLLNALDEAVLLPQLGQSLLLSEVVKLIEAPLTQIAVSSENARLDRKRLNPLSQRVQPILRFEMWSGLANSGFLLSGR